MTEKYKRLLIQLLKMSGNFTAYLDGETPFERGEVLNPDAFRWLAARNGNAARRIARAYKRAAIIGGRRSPVDMTGEDVYNRFTQAVVTALNGWDCPPVWQSVFLGVKLV